MKMKFILLLSIICFIYTAKCKNSPVVKITGEDYSCRYTARPISLTGQIKDWQKARALPLVLTAPANIAIPGWLGPKDVQVVSYMLWDKEFFYFAAVVDDASPTKVDSGEMLWIGDGLQLAFDPLCDSLLPDYDGNDIELGFGQTQKGLESFCWIGGKTLQSGKLPSSIKLAINPIGKNKLIYEMALPWKILTPFKPELNSAFSFNMIYNEGSASERRGWIMWTPGIAEAKLPFMFHKVRLTDDSKGSFTPFCITNKNNYQSGDEAEIYCYLNNDSEQNKKAAMQLTVRKKGNVIHEENKKIELKTGLNRIGFEYSLGRLKGIPLDCSVICTYPGSTGIIRLNTSIHSINADLLKKRAKAIAAENAKLRDKIIVAEKDGIQMFYPKVTAAVIDITLKYRNRDLNNKKLLMEHRPLRSFCRQFDYLERAIRKANTEISKLTKNPELVKKVPNIKMEDIKLNKDVFTKDGSPVMLVGPLGWFKVFDDAKLISEVGFNIVSSTIIPDAIVPAPGKKRTDYLTSILKGTKAVNKANLALDFLSAPHPIPAGWKKTYPNIDKYPGNGWISASLYNHNLRQMIKEYYDILVGALKDQPALLSWDLANEWSFIDGKDICHPKMKKLFLEAMRKRYRSIDKLNRQWNTSYANFEAINPLQLKTTSIGGVYDWEVFRNREADEVVEFLKSLLRRNDAIHPCHIKTIAVMDLNPDIYGPLGIERETIKTDIVGCDCGNAIHFDMYKSLHPDCSSSDSEVHVSTSTTPEEINTDCWSAFLHGQSMRLYFAWENMYTAEMLGAGALLHVPWTLEAAGRTALDIRRLASEIVHFQQAIPKASIAILFSQASLLLDKKYPATLRQLYYFANTFDTQIRFVSERQVQAGELKNIKLLLISKTKYIQPETLSAISDFAAHGGHIHCAPGSLAYSPYGKPLSPSRVGIKYSNRKLTPAKFEKMISDARVKRPLRLKNSRGNNIFGQIEMRTVKMTDNTLLAYIINYNRTFTARLELVEKEITNIKELISDQNISTKIKCKTRTPILLRINYK